MEVPTAWKRHLERASAAKEELSDEISSAEGVVSTSLTSTDNPRNFGDGLNGFDILVRVTDRAIVEQIPDSVDDIAVRYEKTEEPELLCTGCQDVPNELCYNIIQERPVPGGVALYNDADGDGQGECGTLGAIVKHDAYGEMGLTANHVSDDPSGSSSWYQYCDHIGDSGPSTWSGLYDYHMIELNSSTSGTNEIREPGGTNYEVTGYYSKSSVCAFADANAYMRKTGAKTGTTTGTITDCEATGQFPSGDSIICNCDVGPGDSGGMTYRVSRDGTATVLSMVNSNNGKTPTKDDCHNETTVSTELSGMSAYEIVDQENGDISFHF